MISILSVAIGAVTGTTRPVIAKPFVALLILLEWVVAGAVGARFDVSSLVTALLCFNIGLFLSALPALLGGFVRARN